MAGLLNPGAPQPQAPAPAGPGMAPQGAPQQPQAGGDEQPNVTPEEQAVYDKFMDNGLNLIYPQGEGEQAQVSPAVLDDLAGKADPEAQQMFADAQPPLQNTPVDNLASATVQIVLMLEASAEQSGAQIPDEIIFHAGKDLLEELGEVSEAAGIHDFSEEELEGAFYRALDLYRISSPRVDQQSLSQEFQEIQRADQDGSLSQLLPGIDQRAN